MWLIESKKFQLGNIFVASLVPDVILYHCLGASAGDRRDVIAVRPELTPPEFFFDRGYEGEYLFRRGAFHESHDLTSAVFAVVSGKHSK